MGPKQSTNETCIIWVRQKFKNNFLRNNRYETDNAINIIRNDYIYTFYN